MNYHFIGGFKNYSGTRIRLFNFSILHEIKWALALGSPIVNSDIIFRVETFCGNFINIPPSKWRLVLLAGWRAAVRCWNGSISSASVLSVPVCRVPTCGTNGDHCARRRPGRHWIVDTVECRVSSAEDTASPLPWRVHVYSGDTQGTHAGVHGRMILCYKMSLSLT